MGLPAILLGAGSAFWVAADAAVDMARDGLRLGCFPPNRSRDYWDCPDGSSYVLLALAAALCVFVAVVVLEGGRWRRRNRSAPREGVLGSGLFLAGASGFGLIGATVAAAGVAAFLPQHATWGEVLRSWGAFSYAVLSVALLAARHVPRRWTVPAGAVALTGLALFVLQTGRFLTMLIGQAVVVGAACALDVTGSRVKASLARWMVPPRG